MNTEITSYSDLRFFCRHLLKKYGSPHELTEDEKAEEFRRVYLDGLPTSLPVLKAVAAACGIDVCTLNGQRLPPKVRGFHEVYGGKRRLYYREGDAVSGIANTILHEIREMMEPTFVEVSPGYEPLRTTAQHIAGNRFASAVLLPRGDFREKVRKTGIDVLALARLYSKSLSQTLLRVGEVMGGEMYLYLGLYEAQADNALSLRYWTQSLYGEDSPNDNIYGIDHLLPRKGHGIIPGSLVELAIQNNRPYLVKHVELVAGDDRGLSALARPVGQWNARPARVILSVMLESDLGMLEPQLSTLKSVVVGPFRNHL